MIHHRSIAFALLLAAFDPAAVLAQGTQQPCASEEHRQFDFWLGEWEVRTEDGQFAGTNTITQIHGGCALREQWVSAGGGSGESFNIYDAARNTWHQTWVDAQGTLLLLDGGLDASGRMVLRGERPGPDDVVVLNEITWTPGEDGTVLQVWSASTDAGATWRELFRGTYFPKE